MERYTLWCLGLIVALGAAACEAEETGDLDVGEPTGERAMEPAETPPAGQRGAVLEVDTLEGVGPYLTDADGRALYLFTPDTAGMSTCYDACAEAWPPLLADAAVPQAGADPVREELIGTAQRRTGEAQVTYSDWPLYYYAEDERPGDTAGQDVHGFGGEWYLVHPEGRELEAEED